MAGVPGRERMGPKERRVVERVRRRGEEIRRVVLVWWGKVLERWAHWASPWGVSLGSGMLWFRGVRLW